MNKPMTESDVRRIVSQMIQPKATRKELTILDFIAVRAKEADAIHRSPPQTVEPTQESPQTNGEASPPVC